MTAAAAGQFGRAAESIERALGYEPGRAEYHAHHARCLALLKREPEARVAAERSAALEPKDALTLDTLGVVWSLLSSHERAAGAFRAAVGASPDNPGFRYNLAACLRFLGSFDAAEQEYEAAIRLEPRFYRAHSALATLRKQTPERNHVARLTALLRAAAGDVDGELHLRHALAKEYEDLGDYDRAFAELTAGKARKRQQLQYSSETDRALFATVEELFDASRCAAPPPGHDSAEPIFVVGMPRTGTTLVERILSSHSSVLSAGELQNFPLAVKRMAGTPSNQVLDEPTLTRAIDLDCAELGRRYLESTRPMTGSKPRFVDKLPLNFLYVGYIRFALPRAKIVCVRRNPLDTCISNFRQLFGLSLAHYNYSYDIGDIGRYYVSFDRLMAHWDRVLPGTVLQVRYEDLVRQQEAQTRRLLDFCGLAWEPACLAFHENKAPVATASAVQVREPLYASSIGRWRRYARHLETLAADLTAAGIATGFERTE